MHELCGKRKASSHRLSPIPLLSSERAGRQRDHPGCGAHGQPFRTKPASPHRRERVPWGNELFVEVGQDKELGEQRRSIGQLVADAERVEVDDTGQFTVRRVDHYLARVEVAMDGAWAAARQALCGDQFLDEFVGRRIDVMEQPTDSLEAAGRCLDRVERLGGELPQRVDERVEHFKPIPSGPQLTAEGAASYGAEDDNALCR